MTWKHVFLVCVGAMMAVATMFAPQTTTKTDTVLAIAMSVIVGAYGHAKNDRASMNERKTDHE